ncbi:MAG: hypothetical protein IJ758_03195 [Clostridia bacterium]|nr:hypothetical protein [Clostridia bacterium]
MKELNKDKLKSVSGAEGWDYYHDRKDGTWYLVNERGRNILRSHGYTVAGPDDPRISRMYGVGVRFCTVKDNVGAGIGDARMEELLGPMGL